MNFKADGEMPLPSPMNGLARPIAALPDWWRALHHIATYGCRADAEEAIAALRKAGWED